MNDVIVPARKLNIGSLRLAHLQPLPAGVKADEKAAPGGVTWLILECLSPSKLDAAAAQIAEKAERLNALKEGLDVLIHHSPSPTASWAPHTLEDVLDAIDGALADIRALKRQVAQLAEDVAQLAEGFATLDERLSR